MTRDTTPAPDRRWVAVRHRLEDPLRWGVPLLHVAGVSVPLHAAFIVFIAVMLLRSLVAGDPAGLGAFGPVPMAALLAVLLVVVLVHELGHCLACRGSGGVADEALLWPLGGLAFGRPRHDWRGHFAAAAGGPLVSLLTCAAAAVMLRLSTGRWVGTAMPRFEPGALLAFDLGQNWSWPQRLLLLVNWTSMLVLCLNLLPILPLDGGRMLHALLWPRLGYARALRVAVGAGYLGAILVGLAGAVLWSPLLLGVAAMCGLYSHVTWRQLEFTEAVLAPEPAASATVPEDALSEGQREAARIQEEEREVDAILAKIGSLGMKSLSRPERELLRRVTERRKKREQ